MLKEVLQDAEERMAGAIKALEGDLATYRTGRASPALLDRITVEMYGAEMRLIELASISVPEPQQLAIKPYDTNSLESIERSILKSDLGLTPNNDGVMIRLNMPQLTEERRRDLTKRVGARLEEAKVAIRNVRRDAQNDIRDMEKEKMVSEDEAYRAQETLQELTDKYIKHVDKLGKQKEAEIMEV